MKPISVRAMFALVAAVTGSAVLAQSDVRDGTFGAGSDAPALRDELTSGWSTGPFDCSTDDGAFQGPGSTASVILRPTTGPCVGLQIRLTFDLLAGTQTTVAQDYSYAISCEPGPPASLTNEIGVCNTGGGGCPRENIDDGVPVTSDSGEIGSSSIEETVPPSPVTLTVDRSAVIPGDLTLSWNADCSVAAADHAVYEGTLGNFTSHDAVACNDVPPTNTEEVSPLPGNTYYLVVGRNPGFEGSYGTDSTGAQRPPSFSACAPSMPVEQCPP